MLFCTTWCTACTPRSREPHPARRAGATPPTARAREAGDGKAAWPQQLELALPCYHHTVASWGVLLGSTDPQPPSRPPSSSSSARGKGPRPSSSLGSMHTAFPGLVQTSAQHGHRHRCWVWTGKSCTSRGDDVVTTRHRNHVSFIIGWRTSGLMQAGAIVNICVSSGVNVRFHLSWVYIEA